MHDPLEKLSVGTKTPPFPYIFTTQLAREMAAVLGWPETAGLPAIMPAVCWQGHEPGWLGPHDRPLLLVEQRFHLNAPLLPDQLYACRIGLVDKSLIRSRQGQVYWALTYALTAECEGKRAFVAESVLYTPCVSLVSESSIAAVVAPPADTWTEQILIPVTAELIRRYGEVSGDRQAIHLDREAAVRAGYPGVLMHGMYGLGLAAAKLASRLPAGSYIEQLQARFAAPLFAGETLALCTRPEAWGGGFAGYTERTGRRKLLFYGEIRWT